MEHEHDEVRGRDMRCENAAKLCSEKTAAVPLVNR
jgi:hypothetical protein